MYAKSVGILSEIIGANKTLLRVPVYQRNYDWREENCTRFLDDVREIISSGTKHFPGTIVWLASQQTSFIMRDYIIIDGQQRLTTIMILLKALRDCAEISGDKNTASEIDYYLMNHHCDENFKLKLKASRSDDEQFRALLEDKHDQMNKGSRIFMNYEICMNRIKKWTAQNISCSDILRALEKLEAVYIELKEGEDDPQIIFESINSTGLDLSNADLIRNFLLMNDREQERLFNDYWLVIENRLKNGNDYSDLNSFFVHYIVFKTGNEVVNDKYLYRDFVKFFNDNNYTHEEILKELKCFSEVYKVILTGQSSNYPEEVLRYLKGLKMLKQTTCYPFLLHIFDDFNNGIIDSLTLTKTIRFIFSGVLYAGLQQIH